MNRGPYPESITAVREGVYKMPDRAIRIIRLILAAYVVLALFWLGMGWEPLHLD